MCQKNLHSTLVILQFRRRCACSWCPVRSTFHSGYITMILLLILWKRWSNLHSTLVILQLFACCWSVELVRIYIPLWLYYNVKYLLMHFRSCKSTFHSGYITIMIVYLKTHPDMASTFHSGYITIKPCKNNCYKFMIYIPLWLYYNRKIFINTFPKL